VDLTTPLTGRCLICFDLWGYRILHRCIGEINNTFHRLIVFQDHWPF
jgi:hypothetical protein